MLRKILASTTIAASLVISSVASAAIVATYTPGAFFQTGSIQNQHSAALISIALDFGVDAGGDTPIWDTASGGSLGAPIGTFSNLVPGTTDNFFTVSWSGLNILNGDTFSYTGLDLDGFVSPGTTNAGASTPFDGTELISLTFADGLIASANFPQLAAGGSPPVIVIETREPQGVVSAPATAAIMGLGLLGFGLVRGRKQA